MRWIPLDEVISECMKRPGFEEEYIKAGIELEAELAGEPAPRPVFTRATAKRKPRASAAHGFSARPNRARATA